MSLLTTVRLCSVSRTFSVLLDLPVYTPSQSLQETCYTIPFFFSSGTRNFTRIKTCFKLLAVVKTLWMLRGVHILSSLSLSPRAGSLMDWWAPDLQRVAVLGRQSVSFLPGGRGNHLPGKPHEDVTHLVTGGGVTDSVAPIPHTSHYPSDGFGMVIWMKRYVPFGVGGFSIDRGG